MHVEDHHTAKELKQQLHQQTNSHVIRRFEFVMAALQKQSAADIAQTFAVNPSTVKRWVKRYNEEGTAGLLTRPGQGRKPPLNTEQLRRFQERIENGPTPDDQVGTLRGKDFQRILREEFQVTRSLDSVYELLHQLGYESLKPRPQHKDADEQSQKQFKKIPVPDS